MAHDKPLKTEPIRLVQVAQDAIAAERERCLNLVTRTMRHRAGISAEHTAGWNAACRALELAIKQGRP